MSDYITQYHGKHVIPSGSITAAYVFAYIRQIALDSGWFTEIDSGGPSGGNWDDPDSIVKGDWYVLQSVANGWQVLFGIGGYQDPNDDTKGIIAGYDGTYIDPSNPYAYVLADYLGKWDTNADAPKTFDDGAPTASTDTPEFVQIDSAYALGTAFFRGFFTVYHMLDPGGSGTYLDGLAFHLYGAGAYYAWDVLCYVGYIQSGDAIGTEDPYPFFYSGGMFNSGDDTGMTGYCPSADNTAYQAAHMHTAHYTRYWTHTRHGFVISNPLPVVTSDSVKGILPLHRFLSVDFPVGTLDHKYINTSGLGWPI